MDPLRDSAAQMSNHSAVSVDVVFIIIGIYLWEFFTNLNYEWDVIRGRRPYRWTIWMYLISRWSVLANTVITLMNTDVTSPINCQATNSTGWVSIPLALMTSYEFLRKGSASLLIVLRIFAIWNRNKVIVSIAGVVWVTNLSFLLQGAIRIRAVSVPMSPYCVITNIEATGKPIAISLFVTDFVLLVIMLAGMQRICRRGSGSFELWRFLWKQGIIWLAIVTVGELPPVVALVLNINVTLDMFFLYPSPALMVIAATRIHRSLQHYVSLLPTSDSAPNSNGLQNTQSNRLMRRNEDTSVTHRMEVTVQRDTTYEEYPMSQMNLCGSCPASDKPHKIGADDDRHCCAR